MKSKKKRGKSDVLLKKDLDLLYEMYKKRVLTTGQIVSIRELGKWYVYDKLRKRGYIFGGSISGNYIPQQRRQGNYYRISGKGINALRENGYSIYHSADDLKVSKNRIAYLLTANDLDLSLKDVGWRFEDSRSAKKLHVLNRNDYIQGILVNPDDDKEYAVYIFFRKVQENTLAMIKSEIIRNPFENILIVTRGESSFKSIIDSFSIVDNKVIKGGSIKVLPFGFAKEYLKVSSDIRLVHEALINKIGITILGDRHDKNVFKTNIGFDYIVEHNGEEKYFVDLLDNDLMKIEEIQHYRKEEYEHDGRKILALTSTASFHIDFHQQMLKNIQHIEFMTCDTSGILDMKNDILDSAEK